jgi:hypothetical protein
MPLNINEGEHLDGLGKGRPVPPAKWARFMDAAAEAARHHFEKAGARRGLQFDPGQILVQEYWLTGMIVITFCVEIAGVENFYNYTLTLSREAIAELALTGAWPATYADLPNLRAN